MKVEVRSKDKIRPSSPTPESLKNYKISLVDQAALNFKIPFVFFYDTADSRTHNDVDELKKSLSQTLSHMYPLAGRLKEDRLTIECNDEGVEFIVADVAESMSSLLDNPEIEIIRRLIPCNPCTGAYEPSPVGKALAVIQVNRFSCGGMAIGLIISHAIADGSAIATFFNTWATINRGCTVNGSGFVSSCSGIYPPVITTTAIERIARMATETAEKREKYAVRRFIFPKSGIDQLREQLRLRDNDSGSLRRPTRMEALTAFVWAAVIRATQNHCPQTENVHKLSCMVNLRNRIDPPLPPNCLGNVLYGTIIEWEGTGSIDCHSLVRKIHDSLLAVNDGLAKKKYGEGGSLQAVMARGDEILHEGLMKKDSYCLYTTSLCGLPFYEADFGWGKPRWVVDATLLRDLVIFMDTKNRGVEAWMGLPKEVMHIIMQDHHFLGYVSGFPKSKL